MNARGVDIIDNLRQGLPGQALLANLWGINGIDEAGDLVKAVDIISPGLRPSVKAYLNAGLLRRISGFVNAFRTAYPCRFPGSECPSARLGKLRAVLF